MAPRSAHDPPFEVPAGLHVISKKWLKGTPLLDFYNRNRDDFFAIMAVRYFEIMNDPDAGALTDPKKGFDSYCDVMTAYFLAPPGETLVTSKDEKGNLVNFFGEALTDHLETPNLTAQQLYAYDASEKHSQAWKLVNLLVRHAAIDCFQRGLSWLEDIDILKARTRIQQLQGGKRKLDPVPKSERRLFV